jgi:hypothetical protein
MNRKSYRAAAFSAAVAAALLAPAGAVRAQNADINVTVDGDVVPFAGQRPVQRFGTVLVPLRGVFEKLGANVAYDPPTKTILAVKGATSVSLALGSATAQVNGQARTLAVPAQAVNGTTLVPLRFVSEALGADVAWRPASRTVVISTTGASGESNAGSAALPSEGAPTVESLTTSADGRALRAGEELTVTLRGTPGGAATFTVPGVKNAAGVAMRETGPGTYVGSVALPQNLSVKGATVLASIKKDGASSPVIQAGQSLTVDTAGPAVAGLSPAPNAAVAPGRPLVYGTFSDAGTGVRSDGARVLVNGRDVTAQTTVTESFFSYRPDADLPLGKNTVTVVVPDVAGNETRREWAFNVSQDEALVKDLTVTPATEALGPGDVLTVRLAARPGGTARFSVGTAATDRPMTEESPGVYVGTYTVKKGDSIAQAPVSARFTLNGRTVTQTAGRPVTIAAGAPDAPTITAPATGASVGGGTVTLAGKAAPNATVRYRVEYTGTLLILPTRGTVAEGEAKADAQGNWRVENVALSSPPGVSKLSYAATVTAVGAAGEESEPVTVEFRK